jgi:RNA polymerase sigma-70 factor, ECF subfamily
VTEPASAAGWTAPHARASMLRRGVGTDPPVATAWKAARLGAMATLPLTRSAESDRSLLDRVARGEEAALEQLYDGYAPVLYALAYRIAGERSDAEEIVLDSFAQVWRDATRFRAERGSAIAWLTTICRSRALDLVRARGRRARTASSAATAEPEAAPAMGTRDPGGERELEHLERRKVVADALRELSSPQRQAIELAYYDGLSHSQIAERLGEPLGTVKTRVRLAMERLRELLRPYYLERSA